MVFHIIPIQHPSPRVLGKLRKGGRVRIMSGEGLNLIVHSERYNPISRTFGKGKAFTIELSPAEVEANMNPPADLEPHLEGKGIGRTLKKFGRSVKRGFEKVGKALAPVGKVVLPVAKQIGHELVREGVKLAPQLGSALGSSALSGLALLAGQPELVPMAEVAGSKLGGLAGKELGGLAGKQANKQIDKFDPYHKSKQPPSRAVASNVLSLPVTQPLAQANMGNYLSSLSTSDIEMELAKRRGGGYSTPFDTSGSSQVLSPYTDAVGQGLYAQSRGRGVRSHKKGLREVASMGIHGNLLGHGLPPALMSQPYSSNFQMASRLPPAYASIIKSGSGLYA